MPAEYEPHAATWLAWPHNPDTWPGCLDEARREFARLVETIAESEPVHLIVQSGEQGAELSRSLRGPVELHVVPSDDSWMRDIGPTFVHDGGALAAIDWTFNSWGGKYPPWDRDDRVAARVAELAGVPRLRPDLVVEGGSLEVDGEGTLLATRSSLLGPTRNPGLGEAELEARLGELLGCTRVIWLDAGLAGDDTDGHIDNLARFVAPGRVLCASEDDPSDPNHGPLAASRERLERAQDARGRRLAVERLPMPEPVLADGERMPASYANFYIANRLVAVPQFGGSRDRAALEVIQKLFPDRPVRGVPARTLVRGLGTLHCLSQQQPAPPA